MNLCTFVAAMMPHFSVALSCRLVGLPRASFYTWRAQHTGQAGLEPGQAGCRASSARARADDALTARIRAIHQESRGTYGSPRVHAELALDALDLALRTRQAHRTAALVFHSDHGTQYTATAFRQRLEQVGLVASMGSVGDCFDNAVAESFFGTLKTELLHRQVWPSHAAAQTAIFRYIYAWYNPRRRHSTLGYASPDQFECHFHTMTAAA
jgi:putative transposase